jgi:pyruvate dehydrogenase E2 component (dihydrolipoamide acetyltransferase)
VLGASSTTEPHAVSGVKALPVVRKLAREVGVDLETVAGTGPDGRITRDDVTAAAEGSSEPRVAEYRSGTPEPAEQPEDTEADEPGAGGYRNGTAEPRVEDSAGRAMSRVRRTIAERVSRSWAEIPHVTTFDEVDATRLLEVKKALTRRTGVAISIDALVVRAVVPALESHPDFNAHLDGDVLRDNETLDMGVAVDTDDGLMLVVVRDVSTQTLTEISGEIARLAVAAKARTATPDEMSGQTFTVSNIGAVGGGYGTPIIPHGTIGILSVGRAVERPVAREGKVVVAPMMPLSLSYDHRVIDGGAGRRFLAEVVENLTEPALFLAD